ncbi:MAG: translation elongation factor Ts [Armatimonadota bacterium]|nr:translation elongation factor Ts [Armatimonadota bacterium]
MASVDAAAVKKLREMTGAGIMDCKGALAEAGGDFDKATTILREKGIASAAKKAERTAADGSIGVYVHTDGKQAALVEVNCETDFVAKTDDFQQLCRDIAMQVVAMKPQYVRREDVPAEVLEAEKNIYRQQAAGEGKPEAILDKIATGRLNKFYEQVCLMEQPFIKDDKKTIEQLVKEAIGKLGENIQVARFVRYKVGEG